MPKRSTLVVSADYREQSYSFKEALVEGLRTQGIHVVEVGKWPSDLTPFASLTLGANGHASVTGGTAPSGWNGLRWMLTDSPYPRDQQENWLRRWKGATEKSEVSGHHRLWDPTFEWISWSQSIWYDTPSVRKRIVVDTRHGTWAGLAKKALKAIFPNFDVLTIHDCPKPDFGGVIPDVETDESLEAICRFVRSHKANVGFALDADAGQFRVIDDLGDPLSTDEVQWLFLQMLGPSLKDEFCLLNGYGSEPIIAEVRRYGGKPVERVSGSHEDFVLDMRRTEALIGFGSKGEIYYRGIQGNRIVLFALCWILDYLAHLERPLSSWISRFREISRKH